MRSSLTRQKNTPDGEWYGITLIGDGKIISDNDLKLDYKEYHYYYSTLGSMLTLLIDNDQIQYEVENGLVYYYKL